MSTHVRPLLYFAMVGAVAVIGCGTERPTPVAQQPAQVADDALARYATDEFVAAVRVRPERLIKHEYFGSLPLSRFLPAPLSLGRLEDMEVEELVVFCGPATGSQSTGGPPSDIEWAAAARTAEPIDLESAIRQWRRSLVPQEQSLEPKPVAIRINGRECFRVPAGSFFTPRPADIKLRFTDRDGQHVQRGVNIGRVYEYRGYIEGETESSAIFTLEHVDQADLVDSHLPLELRLDVFLTRLLDREYSLAQIELRNPDSGLRSEPITFEPKSYVNQCLRIPRKLAAASDDKQPLDLFRDLVSKGRLEVIFRATESGIYLGFGPHDLNVRTKASEYVFVSGHDIVVAQSPATLNRMLTAAASSPPHVNGQPTVVNRRHRNSRQRE